MKLKRSIFFPTCRAHHISSVTADFLQENDIKAVILDLDGNLTGYQKDIIDEEVMNWVKNVGSAGIKLCIVTNPGPRTTVKEIAQMLKLQAFSGFFPKPLPRAFMAAQAYLDMDFKNIAVIGDQLFTDILGGNIVGCLTIWTDTLAGEPEGWLTRQVNRRLERLYLHTILPHFSSRAPYLP